MRNVTDWLRLLVVPLALAAAGQGRVSADDTLILRGQEPLIESSGGEVLSYRPLPSRRWYFRAEGLALKRAATGDQPFAALVRDARWVVEEVRINAAGAEPLLNADGTSHIDLPAPAPVLVDVTLGTRTETIVTGTNDLDFEFQGGYRLALGRMLGDWYCLEFTYFDLGDWAETATVRNDTPNAEGGVGDLMSPFSNFGDPPVVGLDYNFLVNIDSSSKLDSMELNLWHEMPLPPGGMGFSFLLGVRYMNVIEQFQYYSQANVPAPGGAINLVNTRTGNDLLGVQLGALLEFPIDPGWWIDWELKGGIFHNRADQSTRYLNVDQFGRQRVYPTALKQSRTAFVGETSVRVVYEFTPKLTFYAGYQAIWADGLAVASENVPTDPNILRLGPGQLDHDGNIVYHGPHLGLTFIW